MLRAVLVLAAGVGAGAAPLAGPRPGRITVSSSPNSQFGEAGKYDNLVLARFWWVALASVSLSVARRFALARPCEDRHPPPHLPRTWRLDRRVHLAALLVCRCDGTAWGECRLPAGPQSTRNRWC